MRNQSLVLLLGESILMDGIAESLTQNNHFLIRREVSIGLDMCVYIKLLKPDMIVFEWGMSSIDSILSGLSELTNIVLLGLDLDSGRVVVLNSKQFPIDTMNDLGRLLESEMVLNNQYHEEATTHDKTWNQRFVNPDQVGSL